MDDPKSATTDSLVSAAKRSLLESCSNGDLTGSLEETVIPRRQPGQLAPLSFAQQRLWLLNQFENASSVYNVPFGFHLAGRLDIAVVENCLNEIIHRHEALRTTFPPMGNPSNSLPNTIPGHCRDQPGGLPPSEQQ